MDFLVASGTLGAYLASVLQIGLNVAAAAAAGGRIVPVGASAPGQEEGSAVAAATFFETSALLISFVVFGKLLEALAKGRTSNALAALLDLQVGSDDGRGEDALLDLHVGFDDVGFA